MIPIKNYSIRQANESDKKKIKSLIKSEQIVHQHLDWVSPIERIYETPFLIIEISNILIGALACPTDHEGVAWIHLFVVKSGYSHSFIWSLLLKENIRILQEKSVNQIMVLPIFPWMTNIILKSNFAKFEKVVVLNLDISKNECAQKISEYEIRDMKIEDMEKVKEIDHISFMPIWQNSKVSLDTARKQSYKSTVILIDNEIIGYQITTFSNGKSHLARIAISPEFQSIGVGSELLSNLIDFLKVKNKYYLSVNTQENNLASQKLYKKFGFNVTNDYFQVYKFLIKP